MPSVSPLPTSKRHAVDGLDRADLALEEDAPGDREVHLDVLDRSSCLGGRDAGACVGRQLRLGGVVGHRLGCSPVTGSA